MSVGKIGYWEYLGGKFKGWEGIEVYDLWGKKYVHGCTYPTGKYPGGSTVLGVYTPEEFEKLDKKAKALAAEAEKAAKAEAEREKKEEQARMEWLARARKEALKVLPKGFDISPNGEVFDMYGNFLFILPQKEVDDIQEVVREMFYAFFSSME